MYTSGKMYHGNEAEHLATTNKNRRNRHARRMEEAKKLLGGKCFQCGSSDEIHFDHVDPKTKLFSISDGAWKANEKDFWAEVAKCQLLCLPHHAEKSLSDGPQQAPCPGESNGNAKLTEQDVREIRRRMSSGEYQYVVASDYGVTQRAISKIARRETWKHV